ncbi:MAG: hypothetical protein LUE29_11535 [Lachnospiraceae bacterium]|nr:hypothetical protein [Lachnospiraceae bacterium]
MLESLYEWGWIFFIYAFLGWVTEVAYAALKTGKFVNRGFLNGPLCPIYGVGMGAVVLLLTPVRDNFLLLFLGGAFVTSLLEYLTGLVLEKVFHDKWWDYSGRRFNLHGYICLEFSLMWGFGCVLIMQNVHPLVETLVAWLMKPAGVVVFWVFAAAMAVDICDTVSTILKLNRRIKAIDDTAAAIHRLSDEIGERVATGAISAKGSADELKEKSGELKERSGELYADMKEKSGEFYADMKERSGELYTDMKEKSDELRADMKEKTDEFLSGMTLKGEEYRAESAARKEKFSGKMDEYSESFLLELQKKREEYDRMAARYQKLLSEKTRGRRLMKAFPGATSVRYQEALENLKESWNVRKEGKKEQDVSDVPSAAKDSEENIKK